MADMDPKKVKAWADEYKNAKNDIQEIRDLTFELENAQEGLSKSQIKQNQNMAIFLDASTKAASQGKANLNVLKDRAKLVKDLSNGEMGLSQIKDKQQDIEKSILKVQRRYTGVNKQKGKQLIAELQANRNLLDSEESRVKTQQFAKDAMSEFDGILGGLGGKITGFITNPLTIATAALLTFNATQQAIGDQFGAIGVTEFRGELAEASAEFTALGMSAVDAQVTISAIANDFGVGVVESKELANNAARLAVSTALSKEDAGKLIGIFTQTQNLTGEQAENLLASTTSLANANNVAPDKVLADVAQSSEFFAQFADEGGENVLRAAVQARKLGINLQDVEKVTSGLLDFQSSLNAENEASILIGRKLNFQKARELALANDIEGATAAVVEQLGSAEEFNKLNAIQRKALADSAGLEVSALAKIVNKEKEALSLQGALSKQEIKPVPEEVLTQTAQLIGNLQSIGITLAEVLGPPLNIVVGLFTGFTSLISEGIGFVTEYAAAFGILGAALVAYNAKAILTAAIEKKKAIASALATAFKGMSGGPIGIALSIAAGLAAVGVISKLTSMDDGVIGPGGETMVSGPKGSIKLNDQDSMIVGTNLGGGTGGGGGVDTSKLESKQNETNSKLERVAAVLEGALSGPKPALARAMGSSVGDSVEGMA